METIIKVIIGLKVLGLVLFGVVLVISIVYTLAVDPDDPESRHGLNRSGFDRDSRS
ncbi:hypothetical protein [Streptomyces sp. NPDC005046]